MDKEVLVENVQRVAIGHLHIMSPQWEEIDKIVDCGVDVDTAMKIKQRVIDRYYRPISIWHNTEEEMPDRNGDYLVKLGNGKIMDCEYDEDYQQFGVWNEYFDPETMASLGRDWVELEDVEKWMDIPEGW